MNPVAVSVGVFAHNDGATLYHLLEQLRTLQCESVNLDEIIVVSSGSNDATDEIARGVSGSDGRFRLIVQDRRSGKTDAVNVFLQYARHEICVLLNADTLLKADALTRLTEVFEDRSVALVGGRPVPVMRTRGLIGFAVSLQWDLHHRISLRKPKMGELVAFRKLVSSLPLAEAGADEEWLHSEVVARGYRVAYAPEAVVYNRGPSSLAEFVSQRRRIYSQHLALIRLRAFQPSTCSWHNLIAVTWQYLLEHPRLIWSIGLIGLLEVLCRALGTWDFLLRRQAITVWPIINSSKGITPLDLPLYE